MVQTKNVLTVWESLQRMRNLPLSNANIQLAENAPTVSMLIRESLSTKALTTGLLSKRRNVPRVIPQMPSAKTALSPKVLAIRLTSIARITSRILKVCATSAYLQQWF